MNAANAFLDKRNSAIQLAVCRYARSTRTALLPLALNAGRTLYELRTGTAAWEATCTWHAVPDRPDTWDLTTTFTLKEGREECAGVRLSICFDKWSTDNYVLCPGVVYAGNRFRYIPMGWPAYLKEPADHRLDVPISITNSARLNIEPGLSRMEQNTGDVAVPLMAFHDPGRRMGFFLHTEQQTRFGNTGINIEETSDRTRAEFSLTAPCVREHFRWPFGNEESPDRAVSWNPDDSVTLKARITFFQEDSLHDFFDHFCLIRKELTGPTTYRPELPFSAAWGILEDKYTRQNWWMDEDCVTVGTDTNGAAFAHYWAWQPGWIGGGINTYALLSAGNSLSQERAWKTMDFAFRKAQAPTGLFYAGYYQGKPYGDFFDDNPNPLLIRKHGDVTYFFLKQFMLLKQMNYAKGIPETWTASLRKACDAMVDIWKKHGQFGQFVDVSTGNIIVGGSTAGASCLAALTLAGRYFDAPHYVATAREAGRYYYDNFVRKGIFCGGPAEAMQAPDSESCFALVESFVGLYDATGEAEWLIKSEHIAKQFASWVVSYDYAFPPDSTFARLNMRTTGSVIANAQNRHSAPGICTFSGDALLKLYRATGNRFYLELIKDIAHNLTQYLSRTDRPIDSLEPGWINERVNMSDWEGAHRVGEVFKGSCWCEVSCMLTWTDIPGLYVDLDAGTAEVIDNVTIKHVARTGSAVQVVLHNPTRFDAKVRILAETSADRRQPLTMQRIRACPSAFIAAGATEAIKIG